MHRTGRRTPWLALAALVALSGCGGWGVPREETPFYAGVEGLRIHAQASARSAVIGRLALHERVLRSQVESGWAHVRSEGSGIAGWVDDAKLLARIPASRAPAPVPQSPATPAAAEPAAAEPAAAEAAPAEPTPAQPAAATPAAEPAPAESNPATPPPPPDPPRREPAIFDPF